MIPGGTSGQTLVEFAVVSPLLFMILFGIMELALMFNAYEMVHYAAFTAVRTAIVSIPRSSPTLTPTHRAAAIALIPISSPATGELLAGLKKMRGALATLSGQVMKKCGVPLPGDICSVPGMRIFCNLPPSGEEMTARVSGNGAVPARGEGPVDETIIPMRRLMTALLATTTRVIDPTTGKEIDPARSYTQGKTITVEVTHYYNLKIPFVRRVMWILYVRLSLMKKIQKVMEDIGVPAETTDGAGECIEKEVRALLTRLNSPYYPIPITARSTLPLE